ncbi:MAG: DUF4931 domain-containing protein [Candidatus Diapherotrites archaeon]|nr:DUF4931 domain-containing protein [Candidatus Diapherotrites archaeon]
MQIKPKNYFRHRFLPIEVLMAPHRAKRPHDNGKKKSNKCPFCPGNESETSTELARISNNGKWLLRAVKNKFPVIDEEDGIHEVIIEHREHNKRFANFSVDELTLAIKFALERKAEAEKQPHIKFAALLKNSGRLAGASLQHEHSQLLAFKFVPEVIAAIQKNFNKFKERTGKCPVCEQLKEEVTVFENSYAKAIAPKASRVEYELAIIPKRHFAKFSEIKDEEIRGIAKILRKALKRLAKEGIDYNLLYYDAVADNDFHAFIILLPRKTILGGQEYLTSLITLIHDAKEVREFYRKAI